MGKFAKCPYCGDAPVTWGDDYGDIHIQCCDMHTTSGRKWNQYAAAMDLAKAYVAFKTEIDPIMSNTLWPATRAAELRVLEVFK